MGTGSIHLTGSGAGMLLSLKVKVKKRSLKFTSDSDILIRDDRIRHGESRSVLHGYRMYGLHRDDGGSTSR